MGIAVSLAVVAGISFLYRHILHVNQTTAALSFLLAILAVSAVWGMAVSVAMSLVAVVAFNYFFLPPVGALTIADPQNWVALFAFLVTSIVAASFPRASALKPTKRITAGARLSASTNSAANSSAKAMSYN